MSEENAVLLDDAAQRAKRGEDVIVVARSEASMKTLRAKFLATHGGQPWERRVEFVEELPVGTALRTNIVVLYEHAP